LNIRLEIFFLTVYLSLFLILFNIDCFVYKIETENLPVSFTGTVLDIIERIIGRDMPLNMPNITDKNICHDCHVKAHIKVPLQAEITDIMAITGSGNPKFNRLINLSVHYIFVQFLCKA